MSRPPDDDDWRSPKLRRIQRGVDERLERLAEEGALSGLPGEGRRIDPRELAGDDERWAAFRLMKNNHVRPAWSDARDEIDADLERLRRRVRAHRAWLASRSALLRTLPADRIVDAARITAREDARVRAEITAAVGELNAAVDRYNAIVPAESLRLLPFSAGALLAAER